MKDLLSKYYTEALKRLNNGENKRDIIITENCIVLDGCTALFTKEHPFKSNSDFNSNALFDTFKNDFDNAVTESERYTFNENGRELLKIITSDGNYTLVNTKYSKLFDEKYFTFKCDDKNSRVFVFHKGVYPDKNSFVALIMAIRR